MRASIKNNPLVWFFIFAFVITWIPGISAMLAPEKVGVLAFLTTFGPALSALLVAGITEGADGISKLLRSLFQWQVKWVWYLIVLVGPTLMMAVAILLYNLWNRSFSLQSIGVWLSLFPEHIGALVLIFLYMFASIWGEEIGWRGFALPKLQGRFHPIAASLILGSIWALWHLPSFFTAGSVHSQMGFAYFFFADRYCFFKVNTTLSKESRRNSMTTNQYDAIIIGGGVSGATPALAGGAREASCSVHGNGFDKLNPSPSGWPLRDESAFSRLTRTEAGL